ncbi:aldehyde ferredoxin oxidoreductase N-terminal domain-containing protein, partial [Athalassotoga sp.]
MEEFFGYAGKILRVNLENKTSTIENLNRDDARMYLGGAGLSAKILYTELQKGVDPLSPENKIIFSTGPLTATAAPGSGSVNLCFKSPLTGIWGEARSGSDWGPMLRKAGFDILIIEGHSSNPVYLVIENDKIEIH